jgi:DinB family protein
MRDVAFELRSAVVEAGPRLRALEEARAGAPRDEGKWTRKEILGHLVDSAANNHQRFVRAPLAGGELVFPGYAQDEWVSRQGYRERPWLEIVELWEQLNRHLAHAIERIPEDARQAACRIGTSPPATLEWWVRDYLRHLRHHLAQILE